MSRAHKVLIEQLNAGNDVEVLQGRLLPLLKIGLPDPSIEGIVRTTDLRRVLKKREQKANMLSEIDFKLCAWLLVGSESFNA